jgi:outer membrane murein-binding lipoprotein Lpp
MAEEQAEMVPGDLREWLREKAAEQDVDPRDVLVRAIVAYRFLEGESDRIEGALDERFDDVESQIESLDARTDAQVATLEEQIETVTDRLEAGFDNYETILEHLTETSDDAERKIDTLASAVADLRHRTTQLEANEQARVAADDLRREANRHGTSTATCGACDGSVDLGLLSRPTCPHCEATFEAFEPGGRFFGSATLTVGERPALEGEVADAPEPLFEDESRDDSQEIDR